MLFMCQGAGECVCRATHLQSGYQLSGIIMLLFKIALCVNVTEG